MTTDFKVGDYITWTDWDDISYTGIITEQSLKTITIDFGLQSPFHIRFKMPFYTFKKNRASLSFSKSPPKLPETKEEIIANRIKKLWNNSKWVSKNPSQAY